jgi:hypothetical protein
LRYTEFYGPSKEEVLFHIKTNVIKRHRRQGGISVVDTIQTDLMNLNENQLLRLIDLFEKSKSEVDGQHALENINIVRFSLDFRLQCDDLDIMILKNFLKIYNLSSQLKSMLDNQMIEHIV